MNYFGGWKVNSPDELNSRLDQLAIWLRRQWDWECPVVLEPKPYRDPRSLSQNALFHKWCRELSDHFTARGTEVDAESMKEMLKYKFLGTEDLVINRTVIPGQLRKTSKLTKGEMTDFMDKVYAWAADHGVMLTNPADSEYMKAHHEQVA